MSVMTYLYRWAAMTAALLLFACSESNEIIEGDKPATEPTKREIIEVSVPSGDVQTGTKAAFELKGAGFTASWQNLYCTFDATQAEVWIEGNQVSSGQKYQLAVNDRSFGIECRPLVAGQITIELKVADGGVVTSKKLTVNATEKVYDVQLKNIPSPFYIGHRRVVNLSIVDPERPNIQNVKYEVGAKVVKGKGVIHIAGEEDPVWCDTIPDYQPFTAEVRNANWMIMYTGLEVGENQLELTVTDPEEGTSSTSVVSIPVDSSDFVLKPRIDSPEEIERSDPYSIYVQIDEKGHSANRYTARINEIEGKVDCGCGRGTLPTEEGEWCETSTSTTYTFRPLSEGKIRCEIEVRDLYGTVRTLPVEFTVKSDNYDVEFDADTSLFAFTQKTFDFNISGSSDDQNEYQMSVSLETGDSSDVRLLLAAENVLGTGFVDVLKHETLYVSFTKAGTYRFKFEFKDKWSEPKTYYLTFAVKANDLMVDMGPERKTVVLWDVNYMMARLTAKLSVPKPEGDLWQGASFKYDLTGKGVLFTDSRPVITPGDVFVIDRNECTLNFTPHTTGTHTLTFLFTLADGRTATKTIYVDAEYQPVKLNLVCPSGTFYDGQSREISILTSQEGYSGDMNYKFEFLAGTGKITAADGTELTAGTTYPVTQNVTERMNYTAEGYTGQVRIRYTVIGGDGMTATGTASFVVESGLSMTVNVPSSIQMGTPADIKVQASKLGYTGKFRVKYELQKPYPTYVGNGTIAGMTDGVDMEMTGSEKTLVFTPTTAGQTQLLITVTDDTGKSVSQTVLFKISLLPLVVNPSPIIADFVYGYNTFSITIPEGNGSDSYQVSYIQFSGGGTIIFQEENREWFENTPKTLPPGTYQLYMENMQVNENTSLTFTLIDGVTGEKIDTKVKVTKYNNAK